MTTIVLSIKDWPKFPENSQKNIIMIISRESYDRLILLVERDEKQKEQQRVKREKERVALNKPPVRSQKCKPNVKIIQIMETDSCKISDLTKTEINNKINETPIIKDIEHEIKVNGIESPTNLQSNFVNPSNTQS